MEKRGGLFLKKNFRAFGGVGFYLLIILVIVIVMQFALPQNNSNTSLTFTEVYKNLKTDKIESITFVNRRISGELKDGKSFNSYLPYPVSEDFSKLLDQKINENNLKVEGKAEAGTPWIMEFIPTLLMIIVFIVIWYVLINNSQGGGSRVMNFGKSRAKRHKEDESTKVTFADVAGLEEEKEELEEVVDFLKNPKRYIELGARIPKGILMVGPPGTGKTYLSKAVAGEAGVPFYTISGSDFVEMFVGVGASRVRDLFEQVKKNSSGIIFIDEIDAVGRKRGAGIGGGNDEREQTLNQLLVEMDGFGVNEGIIIIGATNRPDTLDPAILRPGRFDRQIVVGRPDVKGREAILKVHSRNKPLFEDVDLKVLARRTPGFTPADIENLMNEAALLSARKRDKFIKMETIEEAITKVIAGPAKKSKVISEKERRLTAYHEAGHAIVATLLPNSDPVHQVTIVPRGQAGGFTMILPLEDKYYATKTEMEEQLIHLLGGRVAEKLVLEDISTGAQNDLERVSAIARGMVTKYGMSDKLGTMAFGDNSDEVFLGKDFTTRRNYSEEVASEIDREIRRIVDEAYEETIRLLDENMDKLHYVAKCLLKYETLDASEYKLAFDMELSLEDEEAEEKISLEKEEEPKTLDTISLEKEDDINNVSDENLEINIQKSKEEKEEKIYKSNKEKLEDTEE
ncbi:MAG: ATP-dependent zinc metalloprotease FtsH [Peptostreptococcaceae bacterium]|jgi:cell division protease FtsH|nr:ATP-dependent zinc metalloprotease FtsH [Peptostreptococcaceae bacterium]